MTDQEQVTYFVVYGPQGDVTHLIRRRETATTLMAEFFRDGEWHHDQAALDIANDGSYSQPISEEDAAAILEGRAHRGPTTRQDATGHVVEHATPGSASAVHTAIQSAFAEYFHGQAPHLPEPIPLSGTVTNDMWSVRFVLAGERDGAELEFLASRSNSTDPPIHARVNADGSAVTLETYQDSFYVDPSLNETEDDGRRRMQEHNDRVAADLRDAGLL